MTHTACLTSASPLATYAIAGLRHCWMADQGRWSHRYHLDGRPQPNESLPESDLYYSLNVLLGLSKVRDVLDSDLYDIPLLLKTICAALTSAPVRNGTWGMALWAAAELGLDAPELPALRLRRLASDIEIAARWTVQDVGLSLTGAVAQAQRDSSWRPLADQLNRLLLDRFRGSRSLFRDAAYGPRRYFATFASQIYAGLALYQFAEISQDGQALAAANAIARSLIALQGPHGQWPWFYLPHRDRVLDPYEVYSVHQHGMGPALLHHAVSHGVPGAREAIVRGFEWIFGSNELQRPMLVPELNLIYRSLARRGWKGARPGRLLHSAGTALTGAGADWPARDSLRITQEMRSYEFGWLLWSFGDREDYPEITDRREFDSRRCRPAENGSMSAPIVELESW